MPGRRALVRATLGVKLALVLFGVVLGALAIVYALVVPRLEDRLVDAKVRELEQVEESLVARIGGSPVDDRAAVDAAAASLNARIVILHRLGPENLIAVGDTSEADAGDVTRDPVVLEAARTSLSASGRVERDERAFAEVAFPVGAETLVLVSAPLDDALADVRLVRRSVVVAGLVALAVSAVLAWAAALALTRRLRRLEGAADRIAAGDFDVPVAEAAGSDEVAQLGRSLDSMRVRLADLDRVRREFIANASHELRTPLFSLGGFLELLADEDVDPATHREFLAETRAQVDRLARLATDLLDLSRLDAGQLHVEKGPIDLADAARTVTDEFRAVADATDHPLTVEAHEAPALGDPERVVQIARILIENALRHTPPGTPVDVRADALDGRASLVVRDEGPGIPPGDVEHVFERFYRAGGGKASGSGLGLAIASELATRMGGRLHVESRPGETVFRLELDAAEPFPREIESEEAPGRETAVT